MFARSWTLDELLVAPQVQILAELALRALQIARQVREVALAVAPLGLGHRDAVLLEQRLQVAHLLRELLDLGVAGGEFLLELLLRALRRRGIAEQPLGVHEADLVVGGLRRRGGRRNKRRGRGEHGEKAAGGAVHGMSPRAYRPAGQKTVPTWNWKRWSLSPGCSFNGMP